MYVRYLIESLVFLALACTFQYMITLFNKDVHLIRKDKEHIAALRVEDFETIEAYEKELAHE